MNLLYSRPLIDPKDVDIFLDVLGYKGDKKQLTPAIVRGERGIYSFTNSQHTLNNEDFRAAKFRNEAERWNLRTQIVKELFTQKRLDNDDLIKLKRGGALPLTEVKYSKEAVLLVGLPAAGKSGISNIIADNMGCITIDPDYAKRKLPEYNKYEFGASLVHRESDAIVHLCAEHDKPQAFKTLYERCRDTHANIIIPKIGYNFDSIVAYATSLKDAGYILHLTLVNLDRKKATLRAIERYKKSKRYVPLGLIFDGYSNEPILNYYKLKSKKNDLFNSFGEISTDTPPKTLPLCLECENNNPSNLFNSKRQS